MIPVCALFKAGSGTTLTAVPDGGVVTTAFNLIPGKDYELVVKGEPKTSFAANLRVAVTAAPEPAAWSLMMLGVGAVGLSVRRSRRPSQRVLAAA